jgi:CPA2 family monovalent cation:H+ antiporter-2
MEESAGRGVLRLVRQLVVAGAGLIVIGVVARPSFRATLAWVAKTKSGELFLLWSLALALGAACAAQMAGLPLSIGAFLAGMVIAESDFRHQIEDDIRPFRDVLVGLFFISIGMQVNPAFLGSAALAVVGWTLVFTIGKGLVVVLVARMLGWPSHVAVRTGVRLAHAGEFGLLLLAQAMNAGILAASWGQPMLVALLLTMGCAPVLIQKSRRIAELVTDARTLADVPEHGEAAVEDRSRALTDHVILCGCGRVGRPVAVVLEVAKIPYIAIESDLDRFHRARSAGHHVVFADASRSRILDHAGIERASSVVITLSDIRAVQRVLRHARHRNAHAPLIVSAADDMDLSALVEAGATIVFPEHLAAGLALAGQVLRVRGHSEEKTASILTQARAEIAPALTGHLEI